MDSTVGIYSISKMTNDGPRKFYSELVMVHHFAAIKWNCVVKSLLTSCRR